MNNVLKKFEDCIEKIKYGNKIQRSDYLDAGTFPIVSQESDLINGYWNDDCDVFEVKKPVIIFGDHTRAVKYVDFSFVLGADGAKIIKPKEFIDSKFFYYFLQANPIEGKGYSRHYRYLKDLKLAVPSLAAQQKVVTKLDAIFTEIDKATAVAEANAKNAEALFQSYLTEVFERGGEGWERRQLSDIAKVVNGYAFKSGDFISENGIKCIKIANVGIRDFVCEANEFLPANYSIKHPNFLVSEGAIVIPLTRTIIGGGLKVAIVPKEFDGSLLNQRVAAINAIPSLMDGELIYFYLSSSIVSFYVLSNVNALMQPNLSIKDLLRMPIPVPPLKIQHDIKNRIKNGIDAIKKIKEENIKKTKSYLALKNSILKQAFNGELVKD